MIKFLKAFGQFWYDFIIGDDWKIAVSVILALAATLGLYKAGVPEPAVTVIGGVLVLIAFVIALVIDIRPRSKKG
ncbi:hypothetical protein [Nakamurella lactea]|uniref:hypothetical protein n=1 Tax=Nakamurella lactea TaxID=459515 RepID=UPI000418B8A1|nr:hypothetical protein [Nakamurella lactea]